MTHIRRARPLLDRYWSIYAVGEHGIELRSLGRSVRLSGSRVAAVLSCLLPALDGRQTVEEICSALPDRAREEADAFLTRLLSQGLIADAGQLESGDTGTQSELDECLRVLIGPDSLSQVRSRLACAPVAVFGTDQIARTFTQILCDCEIVTVAAGHSADALDSSDVLSRITRAALVVGFGAGPGDGALERLNTTSLTTGTPWLPVASDGTEAYLGPLVLPGRSSCLACLHGRLAALGRTPPQLVRAGSRPMIPGTSHLVAGVAAAEAVKFLIGIDQTALIDAILRIHLRTLEWTRADVLRMPRCPACAGLGMASALGSI